MTIRVAQVATGNAGRLTLRQLIADDRFELVAVSTSSPDKVGTDAGELAGVDVHTGIAAVGELDALIAAGPECVVYCAMGDTRPVEATNDVRKLLEAGSTLIVIEHNLDVIKTADYIIDLGPDGGEDGGHVVATGTPEQLAQNEASFTGRYVKVALAEGRSHAYAQRPIGGAS